MKLSGEILSILAAFGFSIVLAAAGFYGAAQEESDRAAAIEASHFAR